MFLFQIRLALINLRKTPLMTLLVTAVVAVGVGVFMTSYSIYHFMSSVPLADKQETLWAVQLDTLKEWPNDTHKKMVSFKDARTLLQSDIPVRHSASFFSRLLIGPADKSLRPFYVKARVTTSGLFPMFSAPFLYGAGWDKEADSDFLQVAVINKKTNDKLFGGRNSIGEKIYIGERLFEIIGVLDEWVMTPRLYDLKNSSFEATEDIFIPFSLTERMHLTSKSNIQAAGIVESDDPYNAFLNSESTWIPYWVEFNNKADVERYKLYLKNYVAEQLTLGRFEPGNDSRLRDIKDWILFHEIVNESNALLVGLSALFVLVCVINVIVLLFAKSLGRMKEFSIYRTLGASKAMIFQMQMVEVAVLGFICGLFAIITSLAGLEMVKAKFSNYDQLAHLDPTLLVITIFSSVMVCTLAYLYPATRACQDNPVAHLNS